MRTHSLLVVEAVQTLPCSSALLDGEVAITLPNGRTSFQALQNGFDTHRLRVGLTYYLFDLLELDGDNLDARPLEYRKQRLESLIPSGHPLLRYSQHFEVEGPTLLRRACELGAEGIVSKRRTDRYRPGRSESWLKTECVKRQEFVIGGFTEPEGWRVGIGALLLGYYDDTGRLVFAGKVGTGKGFTAEYLREMRRALDSIEQAECPYATRPPVEVARRAHWVKPVLVGEVAFVEWTGDGSVRHASFQGFRADKGAGELRKE